MLTFELFIQKIRAFATHATLSLVVLILATLTLKFFWYPGVFFDVDGGWEGLKIVFAVDVVLGPLLTFVVYEKFKKGLKFDLTLIVLMQFICLGWGLMQTWNERPLLVVLVKETFKSLNAQAIDLNNIPMDVVEALPGKHPKMAFVVPPDETGKSLEQIQRELLTIGYYHVRYNLFQPLDSVEGKQYVAQYGRSAEDGTTKEKTAKQFYLTGKYKTVEVELDTNTLEFRGLSDNETHGISK